MKVRFGLRSSILLLFLILYLTSMLVINSFYIKKHQQTSDAFKNLQFDDSFTKLSFNSTEDSLKAKELLNRFRETLATTEMIQHEAKIYSAAFLLLLMLVSIVLFIIIFYKITRPLKELQSATANISRGDFSVKLHETGIKEIKELKSSFNRMSRELDSVQKKLIEAEKMSIWKELSRILAHEIKNPLTPIQLSVQRLEEKYEQSPQDFEQIFSESINIIQQELENLQTLASSFSNFAKNIEPAFTVFDPCQYIERIIEPYQHKYKINLKQADDCLIKFDQTHLYQIITNILQNSIEASGVDQPIEIIFKKDLTKIVITISDLGHGISARDLPRIFEPYFSRKKKGTGLGLALVKKLITLNKAEIKVKSELNQGTTFKIIIRRINENPDNR